MGFWLFMLGMDLLTPLIMIGFGKLWKDCGLILLPVSVIVLFFVLGKDISTIGTIGGIIGYMQLIFLIGLIIPTEIALKRNFDKNGNWR